MNFYVSGVSAVILIGYISSFRPLMIEKEKYVKSVGALTLMDAIDTIDKDILSTLLELQVHPSQNEISEKLQLSAEDLKLAMKDVLEFSALDEIHENLVKASGAAEAALYPALNQLVQKKPGSLPRLDGEFQRKIESFLKARSEFVQYIEKSKTRAVLSIKISGAQQSQVVNRASMILGLILLLGISSLILNFRKLSMNAWSILSRLNDQLSYSIGKIISATDTIDSASKQVSSSAAQNAAALEETASSMEEVNRVIIHSTKNANKSLELSRESQKQVELGNQIMDQMTHSMSQIQAANHKLENILQIISEIGNKTRVINDIVFETRLLSFNASIEAARAGTFGKGFTVVAEEIGKLASVSGTAAEEIRLLLESSTNQVHHIVKFTQERVIGAKDVMERCDLTFRTMAKDLVQIGEALEHITNSAKEQEVGIQETQRAVTEISDTTHKNSNAAGVLAGQVSSLSHQITSINGLVSDLRGYLYGNTGSSSRKSLNPGQF